MAQLAIKGHSMRGSEVIALLEMLGGKNIFQREGNNKDIFYYIDKNRHIQITCGSLNYILFTLEEFEEKFPYKVGDKVIYEDKRREITKMVWEEHTDTVAYKLDDKLYCNVINKLQLYKEDTMGNNINYYQLGKITAVCFQDTNYEDKVELQLGNDYEIKEENGKYYAVKKQPKYPKTYEECCKVVNASPCVTLVYNISNGQKYSYDVDNIELLNNFRKLKICRDAYWKIAGEQMGLGKPWEPNWSNGDETKFCIYTTQNIISLDIFGVDNRILAFPTEEMRDAFYENFKNLIETCKELL